MKYNVMGLLRNAAHTHKGRDSATAYAVLELANNLRLVMRGEEGIEDFKKRYTGEEDAPIDIDRMFAPTTSLPKMLGGDD